MHTPSLTDRLALRQPPASAPVGRQRWSDLLFLHWRLAPEAVQAKLPAGLTVDVQEGAAWLGIVPFFMERIRPVYLPPLPWLSWFQELNVRTYVHDREGRPGVYFFSLDCNQPVAVARARRCFHLAYQHARMSARRRRGEVVEYTSQRRGDDIKARYSWRGEGTFREAQPGSLEFFLVERYVLFTARPDGTLVTGRVYHAPYRIRNATVSEWSVCPAELAGFSIPGAPDSTLMSAGVDVAVFRVEPVR